MSFDPTRERNHAMRLVTVVGEFTPHDAARDLMQLLSHVEDARQALERDIKGVGNTFGEGHRTADCDMCSRAAEWLPILNGSMR